MREGRRRMESFCNSNNNSSQTTTFSAHHGEHLKTHKCVLLKQKTTLSSTPVSQEKESEATVDTGSPTLDRWRLEKRPDDVQFLWIIVNNCITEWASRWTGVPFKLDCEGMSVIFDKMEIKITCHCLSLIFLCMSQTCSWPRIWTELKFLASYKKTGLTTGELWVDFFQCKLLLIYQW